MRVTERVALRELRVVKYRGYAFRGNEFPSVDNLRAICEVHFPGHCSLEIVDVLEETLRALSDDILVTPTLVKVSPGVRMRVIGNLSDERKVLSASSAGAER